MQLQSEPYSPSGSMVAKTLVRAVRNTSLDEWSVLLRETLQNSVDARLRPSTPVRFHAHLFHASYGQRSALQRGVFTEVPKQMPKLAAALRKAKLPLLVIADWETRGLGGPTRADLATNEKANFRDFFLNVGREESKGYQGGTYGLGRGVLFDISDTGTIVVFTKSRAAGKPVTRLMAMGISESFQADSRLFTGRHWWCSPDESAWPEPITGKAAERIAEALELNVIPEDTTGTAIMVIAPRFPEDYDLEHVLDEMLDTARLYGWPLMIGRKGKPSVEFEFGVEGEFWEPEAADAKNSPVRIFVEAYRMAESTPDNEATSWRREGITFGAGRAQPKPLGSLVFRHVPPVAGTVTQSDDDDSDERIPRSAIALMREPRMVVKYLPVAKHPQGAATVGVFIADPGFDRVFAESEPVAHDEWIPTNLGLGRNERNPIKQALDKIKSTVKSSWITDVSAVSDGGDANGIAPVIGDLLGGMVSDTEGFGGLKLPSGGKRAPKPRPAITRAVVSSPILRVSDGGVVAVFPVEVVRAAHVGAVHLAAEPEVVLDSGLEKADDRPEGASFPAVLGWEDPAGSLIGPSPEVLVDTSVTRLSVLVEQPRDTAVTVEVNVIEVPA